MTSVPSHVTPLRLAQPAAIDVTRAAELLSRGANAWLGTPVDVARDGFRRFLTDLSLPLREHSPSLVFKKAAYVDLGDVRSTSDGFELEIGWQSSSLAPLFPVFSGHLSVGPAGLRLEGFYAPPGGEIGAVLDKAFLSIAARGTARWFLERTAEVITTESPDAGTGEAPPTPGA